MAVLFPDFADSLGLSGLTSIFTSGGLSGGDLADGEPDIDAPCAVHFIDVGQGDSALIQSDGYNILIDSGETDKAADVIRYLRNQGVEQLDMVVMSHPHSDHMGSMGEVISAFKAEKVLINRLSDSIVPTNKTYRGFLESVKSNGLTLTASKVGQKYDFGEGTLTVLGPVEDYEELNDTSIVARFDYNGRSVLFTGDMEKAAEKDLIASGADLSVDILKVGHHGSTTSSTKALLAEVNPAAAVIEVGEGNDYGHPNDKILDALKDAGAEVYRTDRNGTVVATIDNAGELYVSTEK